MNPTVTPSTTPATPSTTPPGSSPGPLSSDGTAPGMNAGVMLSAHLEAMPEAALLIDGNRRLLACNQSCQLLWNFPAETLKTADATTLLTHIAGKLRAVGQFANWLQQLARHPLERSHHELLLKDERLILCHTAPLLHNQQVIGRAWHFRDISAAQGSSEAHARSASAPATATLLAELPGRRHDDASVPAADAPRTGAPQLTLVSDYVERSAQVRQRRTTPPPQPPLDACQTLLAQASALRQQLSDDLREAHARRQFEIHYQPIIDLKTGQACSAEALLRWRHPSLGMLHPSTFVPLAEDLTAIIEVGDWVFREVARMAKQLRSHYRADFQLSLNSSPVQFTKDDTVYKGWFEFLRELHLPGAAVCIEITENLLLAAGSKVGRRLEEFHQAGMQIALDDFGTGYSSLAYLKKFVLDYLKIDRSFVARLESDPHDQALCTAIITVAHQMGFKVIAEGVETEAQLKFLQAAGCDLAQGHHFATALPQDAFLAWLQQGQMGAIPQVG